MGSSLVQKMKYGAFAVQENIVVMESLKKKANVATTSPTFEDMYKELPTDLNTFISKINLGTTTSLLLVFFASGEPDKERHSKLQAIIDG